MDQILVGADPELFLKQGDKFRSGYGVIPGTKLHPHKVEFGAVQVDGMALEFNIDPSPHPDGFVRNINRVMAELRDMVPSEYDLALCPTAEFDRKHMAEQPEEARLLGCDPDFNAYTGEMNERPKAPATMRTAAGHVHIGWTKDQDVADEAHFEKCRQVAIQMDWMLGVPSILMDDDKKRRELYGQAGAFRPKPYGCEYRVLSNFWLRETRLMDWVWKQTFAGMRTLIRDKIRWNDWWTKEYGGENFARDVINSGDQKRAQNICARLNIPTRTSRQTMTRLERELR